MLLARRVPVRLAALLAALVCLVRPAAAESYEERRAQSGLRLFRAMLAADLDLPRKVEPDGRLLVVFLHTGDGRRAAALAADFARRTADGEAEPIRGLPVRVEVVPASALSSTYDRRSTAGLFLAEAPDAAALHAIVQFGIARRFIVYSPYEGHVESGVLGGLAIEAQVRPYVNLTTLARSNVTLKDFFLKVAKVHP
jgi:hypothetical protein